MFPAKYECQRCTNDDVKSRTALKFPNLKNNILNQGLFGQFGIEAIKPIVFFVAIALQPGGAGDFYGEFAVVQEYGAGAGAVGWADYLRPDFKDPQFLGGEIDEAAPH